MDLVAPAESFPASGDASVDAAAQALVALLGADAVTFDTETRAFFSQDLMTQGAIPLAVVRPNSTAQVVALVNFARTRRLALYPRGGGMSYSRAFTPETRHAILIDFSRLAAIREINVVDGHVTAEAGCTWAQLDAALAPHGVRSRFWGPMSGATATIGGAISNGSVTFGSGDVGASANSVKSFEIVTGDAMVIRTGSDGAGCGHPFNRAFGPDLTGIFTHDCGALGIKTAITLETQPRPALVDGVSFASDDFDQMSAFLRTVTDRRLASEIIAMDAEVARQNAGPPRLWADLKALVAIGLASGNPVTALRRMAHVALAGRGFLDKALYTVHFVVEARDADDRRSRLRAIRRLAGDCAEIVNTVPLATRANPFPDLPVTHPDGRRMLPIHGVFAWSQVAAFHRAYTVLKADLAPDLAANGVVVAEFFAVVAGVGILYEPVFYWADGLQLFHERRTPDWLRSGLPRHAENPAARALVTASVDTVTALMATHGASHFQIGRLYPYQQRHETGRGDLLRALKARLDPGNICNPGALGL